MALHGLHTALAEVVPDLDGLVIAARHEVWLIGARVKVDIVDALIVGIHGEVGRGRSQGPHLDCAIETCGSKSVGVFWIEGDGHDVVGVPFVNLDVAPAFVPVPSFDCHVVASREHDAG